MATSNAELQAEIDRILRMAVSLEPVDLRYDVNKDGRVSSADAYLVSSGAATIPPLRAPVVSPLSYLQVGQQLFNRELAQPEIAYLQSLYGQDVDPTEMSALQAALNPNQNIQNLYQSVLGRQADPFGGMYWSQAFGSEVSPEEEAAFRQAAAPEIASRQSASTATRSANVAPDLFQNLMPLINARFQQYGRSPTPEDIANLRSQAEVLGLNLSDPNLGSTSQYQTWANYVANAAKPKTQPWWIGQFASEADANYVDTNRNQQIEETERAAWRSKHDPNSNEYKQRVSQEQEAARQEAARAAAAAAEQERLIQEQLRQEAARQESIRVAAAQEAARQEAARVATAEQERLNQQQQLVQLASYIDPSSSGGAWGTASGKSSGPGFGSEGMIKQIAQRLQNVTGVSDINDLELRTVNKPRKVNIVTTRNGFYIPEANRYLSDEERGTVQTQENVFADGLTEYYYTAEINLPTQEIYNKKTGQMLAEQSSPSYDVYGNLQKNQELNIDLGGWGEGEGMTYANLTFNANGKPVIKTWGVDTSDAGTISTILSIALMAVPGIGQAVGAALLPTGVSTAVATAVGNAVINAGLQVASGVPIERAILNSAASFGVSQFVPNLTGNVYVDNAVRSVATAALTGGDVGNALANSLIATGGNELLGNTSFTGDKVVDSAIASAITSGVQAAATDGDVGASIIRGGIAGGSSELSKQTASSKSAKSGAGFIGEDAVDSVAGAIGNDTVTSGLGIDSVNAGVAQDNVLDLVQQDIDRISSNNVQGNLNAEQEIQSATPVEPGTSDFTIPGGTTVGEFAEPGTAGFSRNPVTTDVATTGTTGATATQDTPYVAPNGMHNRAAFIAAGGGTSDADYAKYVQAVNAVISEGKSGNLIKPSSVNSAGKQLPSTTGSVTTATPRVDSVLGSVAAQGTASFGQTFGGALSALGFTDAGKAVINKANALADAATEAEGPEITVGKQYINEAIDRLVSSSNARDAFINLGNLASTIYDNPKAFGAVLGSETFEELLQIGTLRGGSFLTKELIASSIENGGGAYNTEYDKQIKLGASPEVAHESAQKAAGVAAGTTAALGLGVAGAGRLAGVGGGSTSVGSTLAKQTAQEALEAGTVTSAVDYALTGSIDVQNSLREALSDIVYGGPTSGVVQTGSNVISSQIPSSDTSSNVGVVVAVDPVSNQATVINNTGNVSVIDGSNLSEGESVVLDGAGLVQQPSIGTNVVVGTGSTTGGQLTYGDDNVVAGDESNGVVLQNNNDGTSLVLTQGGGSTVVPSVDSSTGNQLQPGSTVVVNTANNTASTALVTQPTGGAVVSQDAGQVVGTGSTLPSTPTGGASTGSTAVVTQTPQAGTGSTASSDVTGGQVDTGSTLGTGTVTTENVGVGTGASTGASTGAGTSTGIVLQNNGDGTVLVLTNNGNASIVSDVDSNTGGTLTTGSSVVVNNNTGTASSTGTDTGTGTGTGTTTGVDTSGAVTAGTGVTTGATTDAGTGVTTGGQVDTGGTQVLPGTATVGGATSTDSTGTSTLTPGINVELPETIGGGTAVEDNVSGGGGNDLIVGGGGNDVIAGEPTGTTTTEEDLLLEQIIRELEPTPPVSEGVPIPEPVFPELPLVLPESPTINVGDRLTIRPVVDRGYRRPSVSPGSRVEESAQILPIRPGLSEGGTGGIEGTTEQEQEPVWNVRSLKLRRLLGI